MVGKEVVTRVVKVWEEVVTISTVRIDDARIRNSLKQVFFFPLSDRGGNRGRYGNFNDDQNREEGFSGGRQNYGQNREGNSYGNREERYNNYGNRGANPRGGGGGSSGSGYDQERRTSESMAHLSLEGKKIFSFLEDFAMTLICSCRKGRWSTKIELGSTYS